jgi:hypothetical protein
LAVLLIMTPAKQIFQLALKQHPLSLALVTKGLKPAAHCLVKAPKKLIKQINNRFAYHKISGVTGVGFYVFPLWLSTQDKSDQVVQLMIFNDETLSETIPLLDKHQSTFTFKTGADVRLTNIGFYKLARTRKNWNSVTKQDVTVVCGLSFGFPEASTVKFGLEVLTEKMLPQRQEYRVKGEDNLVFIGYPETASSARAKIKQWAEFKLTASYQNVINHLKKIMV